MRALSTSLLSLWSQAVPRAGLTHTSLLQPPRGPPGPAGDPGHEVRGWLWLCCGLTGAVGWAHWGCSETWNHYQRTVKVGKGLQDHLWGVDPHHAPMWPTCFPYPWSISAPILPALLSTAHHSIPGDDELTVFLSCIAGRTRQARSSRPERRGWRPSK